jgi:hypothetical protein
LPSRTLKPTGLIARTVRAAVDAQGEALRHVDEAHLTHAVRSFTPVLLHLPACGEARERIRRAPAHITSDAVADWPFPDLPREVAGGDESMSAAALQVHVDVLFARESQQFLYAFLAADA